MNHAGVPAGGYAPEFFDRLEAAEGRHFWFRHRNRVIEQAVRSVVRQWPLGYRVLEVGCGTGNTLRVLERTCAGAEIVGTEPFEAGLRVAQQRVRCRLVRADVESLPDLGRFDLVAAFDVLEHVADDRGALRSLRSTLTAQGRVLLTVPAYMSLWSYADEAAHHCRRYSPSELRDRLTESGFAVEFLTPFMTALHPVMWLGRRAADWRAHRNGKRDVFAMTMRDLRVIPGWNEAVLWVLKSELRRLGRRKTLPIGTSLLAIARPV